ncbi:cytochrome P450 [Allokutzneria sp. A3M-2-11 16]|uniref:cytochrome P450 n=1 Tax=Allokutzneria sp. A3M-2-11 16 TaxID=2962043 RepID=UPI0020B7B2E3|nr:cytochrome P450 [Allokutzneria sp. A3M-2-11 16]MCP3803455.1 cytochrome P450 [Allokutzneria sp. A3M-2-11 16]
MPSSPSNTKRLARLGFLATVQGFRRDPFKLFTDIAALPDGLATASAPGMRIVFITHPDHAHHVLQENHQNYDKNAIIYNNARPFLGNGLPVTHGGEDWVRRRRLMQPAFQCRGALTLR